MDLTIEQAMEEMQFHMVSTNFSKNTINDYNNSYRKFTTWIQNHNEYSLNTLIRTITPRDGKLFMRHIATVEYTLSGVAKREPRKLAPKTQRNIHGALSSMWKLLLEDEFVNENIWAKVRRPKAPQITPNALTEAEIGSLIAACQMTRQWQNKPLSQSKRLTGIRDEAMISLMLASGIRVSELCDLKIEDISWSANTAYIRSGKGAKSRNVPLGGRATRTRIRKWLSTRKDESEWLFCSLRGKYAGEKVNRGAVLKVVSRLGEKAGIDRNVYPHLLRHTALTLMAKAGMSQFQLMAIAGHTDVSMTVKYVKLAAIVDAQKMPSPLDGL